MEAQLLGSAETTKLKENEVLVFTINNDTPFKQYSAQNDLPSPNGLEDGDFIKLSKEFGDSYDVTEFEMFWNTGEIPAFCFIRFLRINE